MAARRRLTACQSMSPVGVDAGEAAARRLSRPSMPRSDLKRDRPRPALPMAMNG